MDERKAALVEALAAKCSALLELQQAAKAPAAAGEQVPAVSAGAEGEPAVAEAAAAEQAQVPFTAATSAASALSAAAEPGEFETAFRELRRWVDTAADDKVG
jgi:isopentenyl diphosphate isomerase/L-lactate dehydrogenase-like FMN-dependent dehydrogenase